MGAGFPLEFKPINLGRAIKPNAIIKKFAITLTAVKFVVCLYDKKLGQKKKCKI